MADLPFSPRPPAAPSREHLLAYASHDEEKPLRYAGLIIASIFIFGALIRAAAVFYFSHIRYQYPDEDLYWELGARLLSGHGISLEHDAFGGYVRANEPTAYFGALMAPITAFLRIISFGHISIARLILGEFAWFGTAIPMYLYARKKAPIGTSVLFLLALALFPNLHFFGSFVMTENILIPLVCTALYLGAAMQALPTECAFGLRKPWFIAWSVLYGFIHLIKMNLLLFQPLQFWIDTRKMPWKHKAIAAAIMLACTGIVILPWAWRNHTQMGTWALETKSGFNLWMMNNPARNKPVLKEDFVGPPSAMPSYVGRTEAQRDAACKDEFLKYAGENPGKFLKLSVSRFLIAYSVTPVSMNLPRIVAIFYGVCNAAIYFFAVLGLKQCFRRRWFFDAAGLVVYTVIITSLTNAAFRHRSYADPAMLLLAVIGVVWVFEFLFPPAQKIEREPLQ